MVELALAVDIGGTKLATGLVTFDGDLVERRESPTAGHDAEGLYQAVLNLSRESLATVSQRPAVCGVGSGGPSRENHRWISPLSIPVWRDFPLLDRLSEDLGLRTHVDNDAKALALAEGWRGAAVGVDNFIGMVVSTGVGGGIVLNGRLLDGADGNAGHIGHVFVNPGGHPDANGVSGLLEGSASGTGIAGATGRPAAEADETMRRQVGVWVGRAVASVANLLDLQLAVVAGSVALGYGDDFFDSAQGTIDELSRIQHARGAKIIPAGLGDEAPLIGAAAVGLRGLGVPILS
ncbi:MAG: ROK family protein [Acidimicrobiales bacterium]